ncbi:MAG: DNA-3-methyladenine glycosylase I, partial [Armatimonadota bacterium]
VVGDDALFERLTLEIHQAGLSWELILRKRDGYRKAFHGFDPATVAAFTETDVERLAADPGIVRNRLKIRSTIHNAGVVAQLARTHGSFAAWLDTHHPMDLAEWVALFRRTFRFMGPEIVGEFLMSTGHLPGAHEPDCPVHARAIAAGAAWARLSAREADANRP